MLTEPSGNRVTGVAIGFFFVFHRGKVMFSQACVIPSVHRGRGLPREGSASRGVCIQWGLHPGRGLHPGGCASRGGVHPRGSASNQILWDTVNERKVRILLECIFVLK